MKVIKYTFNGEQTLNYLYQNIDIPTDIYIYIYNFEIWAVYLVSYHYLITAISI